MITSHFSFAPAAVFTFDGDAASGLKPWQM